MQDPTTPHTSRPSKGALRRQRAAGSRTYQLMRQMAYVMDRYYLDPIIGLIPGGWGDTLQAIMVVPFVWFSMTVIRSVPLTLALTYYALRDIAVGLIPFFLGNVLDVFNRSYARNMHLVQGFLDDDPEVVSEVNRKAWLFAVAIVVCLALIILLIWATIHLVSRLFA